MSALVAARLRAQRLTGTPFSTPVEAVRHFGAVQAQDYPAAKWALGMRIRGAVEADLDRAYDDGKILRTHVLRPTWHFVAPEDVRWMLELTAPKIRQGMAFRFRELGLDEGTLSKANDVFQAALAGGVHMTRPELASALERAGIDAEGQRLPYLLVSGELGGILVGGPREGRLLSYALLDERAPRAPALDREQAIGELTRRYFTSHGPAQVRDLVWWSGLTQAEVRRGLATAGDGLARMDVDGSPHWFDPRLGAAGLGAPRAHMLPNFDEYTVGYTDRSAILHPHRPFRPELFAFSSLLANVIVISGQVCAAWRKQAGRDTLRIELRPLAQLSLAERRLVEAEVARYGRFLGRRVDAAWL